MAQPFAGQTVECVGHSAANERIPDLAKACRSCIQSTNCTVISSGKSNMRITSQSWKFDCSTTPPLMVTLSCSTLDKQ